jgi:alpha-L-rhamnosidase
MKLPPANAPVYDPATPWQPAAAWPANWIHPPADWETPWIATFRCRFTLEREWRTTLHVTADERYELHLDGKFIGRGSERGDRANWYYESYPVTLPPGEHTLAARVWALGKLAPWAQVCVRAGFFLCPGELELVPLLATGQAVWEVRRLKDRTFSSGNDAAGTALGGGPYETVDFRVAPGPWRTPVTGAGGTDGFHLLTLEPVHWLRPAELPSRSGEVWPRLRVVRPREGWQPPHTVPARSTLEVWLDPEDYVCAYPELTWEGGKGARLEIGFAEAPRLEDRTKVRETDLWSSPALTKQLRARCPFDAVIADGGPGFWRPHWWRCGRLVVLRVTTAAQPVTIQRLVLCETRYPLEPESTWDPGHDNLAELFQTCLRTLQMCAHETYMDCPYYEQLMYAGDTRIQALLTYALTTDDRLPRKAITLFDASRLNPSGWTTDAYPTHEGKIIPPFSFWWIHMVHDYALWRDDPAFVHGRLAGVRAILDLAAALRDRDGVLVSPKGWNFVDSTYPGHVPPGGQPGGRNCAFNFQCLTALEAAAALEDYVGEPELAALYRRRAEELAEAIGRAFWDHARGLFADDPSRRTFSEQTQVLGLMTGLFADAEGERRAVELIAAPDSEPAPGWVRCAPYFLHYLFTEVLRRNVAEPFWTRLKPWFTLLDEGYRTTPEIFGKTRSDCHAWSAHPLYHYLTGIMGIRPAALGFARVEIIPQLVGYPGDTAAASLAHPLGPVRVVYTRSGTVWKAEIELPEGLSGMFTGGSVQQELRAGRQEILFG